ncbi:myelin protein zero-like 1 like isoform X1 [Lepisosteus oculatus]|uniref:myelin protein zero-like 1 like isoform X1 n=1 Tax=Lepisosteus oculatus TaxID=7918 RepID=UPI00073FCEB4|nr:PREDICTED: myelin protein zero-like protein 1 isoform X2 [Lepisosteus oculatus]
MESRGSDPRRAFAWILGSHLLLLGTFPATALDVYTPPEIFIENGTAGTLKCTFRSKEVISSDATVSWSFLPLGGDRAINFFYYSRGKSYPGDIPQFKGRVTWVGDLNKKDASIQVNKMHFSDNGTYSCDVKNPPDIVVTPGRIQLYVVLKDALPQSNAGIIAGAVIGAILGLILIIIVFYLILRRRGAKPEYQGCTSSESMISQPTRMGKKADSSTEGSRCSSPSGPVQTVLDHHPLAKAASSWEGSGASRQHRGPVIYAQLDHSGSKSSNILHKSEPVVYADIRKN